MKRSILTVLLTALCAASAAAQVLPVRVSLPLNPVLQLPKALPGPIAGPFAGSAISLPSPIASVIPSSRVILPTLVPGPTRPLQRVTPNMVVRFSASAAETASAPELKPGSGLFDGQKQPQTAPVPQPRRDPMSSGRRVNLPEWELENELGL